MTDARSLYKSWVLEYSKHPKNEGSLESPSHRARRSNPLCGDRVDVHAELEGERIVRLRFQARGCAIARASASLMCEMLEGQTAADALARGSRLETLLTRGNDDTDADLAPLLGVRLFPGRTGCVTLAWQALADALAEPPEGGSTP